ncbi:MAG: hypothetical protein KKG59_02025 [Nanoarchaeota archaeon]|nr:hypothetical protein [Nanoarchaeota archaeon]
MSKIIIVVNPDENILIMIRTILEKENYDVITAKDNNECIEKCNTIRPDLIFLPIISKGPLPKEIAQRLNDVKIIYLTKVKLTKKEKLELIEEKGNPVDIINYPLNPSRLLFYVNKYVN